MTQSRPHLGRGAGFVAVAFAFVVAMLGTTLPTPLYGIYREEYGFSELTVTIIFATYAVGVLTALLVFGSASDQVGRRRVLLPGLVLSALSAVMFLLAQGLSLLLVGRLLSGLSAGLFTGTATAALIDLARPQRRARATLIATLVNMGGLGCGPLLAGLLAEGAASPLRLPFAVDLALLVPAVAGVWLMPEPVEHRAGFKLRVQGLVIPTEIRSVFVRGAIASFAGFAVLGLCSAVAPAFLAKELGVTSPALIGLVVFTVFVGSTGGQLLLDWIPERLALPAGCLALIVGMAVLALSLILRSLALLVLALAVAGVGQGLSFRAGLTAVNAGAPEAQRAEVASTFFVVCYIAVSLPVVGEGVLADTLGLRPAGLIFASAVAILALIAMILLARSRRDDPNATRPALVSTQN
jgi:MFS family permease